MVSPSLSEERCFSAGASYELRHFPRCPQTRYGESGKESTEGAAR